MDGLKYFQNMQNKGFRTPKSITGQFSSKILTPNSEFGILFGEFSRFRPKYLIFRFYGEGSSNQKIMKFRFFIK